MKWISGLSRSGRMAAVIAVALFVTACGGGNEDAVEGGVDTSVAAATTSTAGEAVENIYEGLSGPLQIYATTDSAEDKASLIEPFTEKSGVEVLWEYNLDVTKFIAASEQGQNQWDLVQMATWSDVERASGAGYLQELDLDLLPVDEFVEGSYNEYGVEDATFGIVLAWNTEKWPESGEHPTSMKDLFNTADFPGKRCMFQYHQYGATLEAPLLADGVAPEDLYPLDVDRALDKLDTIRDDIVWWTGADEVIRFLRTGECDMGVVWSGQVYRAIMNDNAPLAITWQDALYSASVWSIPKNAEHAETAMAFVTDWYDKEGQLEYTRKSGYTSPLKTVEFPEELAPWIPSPENLTVAIKQDDKDYYVDHAEELSKRFVEWLGG